MNSSKSLKEIGRGSVIYKVIVIHKIHIHKVIKTIKNFISLIVDAILGDKRNLSKQMQSIPSVSWPNAIK